MRNLEIVYLCKETCTDVRLLCEDIGALYFIPRTQDNVNFCEDFYIEIKGGAKGIRDVNINEDARRRILTEEDTRDIVLDVEVDKDGHIERIFDEEILWTRGVEKVVKLIRTSLKEKLIYCESLINEIKDITYIGLLYYDADKDEFSEDNYWLPYNGDMRSLSTWESRYIHSNGDIFFCASKTKKVEDFFDISRIDDSQWQKTHFSRKSQLLNTK